MKFWAESRLITSPYEILSQNDNSVDTFWVKRVLIACRNEIFRQNYELVDKLNFWVEQSSFQMKFE